MSSKFERGCGYKFPIYTNTFGYPMIFKDHPRCPEAQKAWDTREEARIAMSMEERLQDTTINGYHPPYLPEGYNRSCPCDICKRAWMGNYFKGLAGSPGGSAHTWWETTSESYTYESVTKSLEEKNKAFATMKKTLSATEQAEIEVARRGTPRVILLDTNRTGFQAVMSRLIYSQWEKMTSQGLYYNTAPSETNSTRHPQPNWTILSNLDELLSLAKDEELSDVVTGRGLLGVSAIGPMTPAQALLALAPIRTAASKDATVVVNINDETLTRYVRDLIKSLE